MAAMNRFGTGLLTLGGLALVGLMAYTLTLGGRRAGLTRPPRPAGAADIAVFYPDRTDWLDFRRGITACQERGLVRIVQDAGDHVVLETPTERRLVRIAWHGVRGVRQAREEVRRLLSAASPPVAVVGSINTVLTVALAEELRQVAASDGRPQPVLLIPWATADLAVDPERGPGPVALLDIDPGRTFRFCLDNQREAELLVRCLADHEPKALPARAFLVVDRNDPYSKDLADAFRRAIEAVAPGAEIVEQAQAISALSLLDFPMFATADDQDWADAIWRAAHETPQGRTTWVVLALQSEPTQRLLAALRSRARPGAEAGTDEALRVLCGDSLDLTALLQQAGHRGFPLWSVSPASVPESEHLPGAEGAGDEQIPAEVVSAIVRCLDQPGSTQVDLRLALSRLSLPADDRAAFGRPLAFAPSGERKGDGLGMVLATRPGRAELSAYARNADGHWSAAVPIRPVPVAAHP